MSPTVVGWTSWRTCRVVHLFGYFDVTWWDWSRCLEDLPWHIFARLDGLLDSLKTYSRCTCGRFRAELNWMHTNSGELASFMCYCQSFPTVRNSTRSQSTAVWTFPKRMDCILLLFSYFLWSCSINSFLWWYFQCMDCAHLLFSYFCHHFQHIHFSDETCSA